MIKRYKKLPRALRAAVPHTDGSPEGINLSQLLDAERCGYRWHTKTVRGIERRTIAPPMDRGSAVHAGIHGGIQRWARFSGGKLSSKSQGLIYQAATNHVLGWAHDWRKNRGQLTTETEQQLLDITDQSITIASRALEEMNLPAWRIVRLPNGKPLVEQKIRWISDGILFYGTPDFVAEDLEGGGIWPWDYKVRERFVSTEDEMFDLQLPTYQYGLAMQRQSIRTVGAIKFQVLARLPETPKLNKNGTMSRQRIATTWDKYELALKLQGLNPEDYREEMRQKLDVKFFQLDRIYRNDFTLHQTWTEVVLPMAKEHLRRKSFHRVMSTWGCNGCWLREFCQAELRGEDTGFLLETSYIDTTKPADRMRLRPEDFTMIET